jgi:hypothetical protein
MHPPMVYPRLCLAIVMSSNATVVVAYIIGNVYNLAAQCEWLVAGLCMETLLLFNRQGFTKNS